MRDNGPVTQKNVALDEGPLLVSRTDLRGVIAFANDAFVAISGFTREELVGQSHNLVRHPDMPPAAFADMWATLKIGQCWVGVVKNRCKNGDHYWVLAAVSPERDAAGQVTGYISVRRRPSDAAITAAEAAYARIRAGSAGLLVKRGQVECAGLCGAIRRWASSTRVLVAAALLSLVLLIAGVGTVGLLGMRASNQGLESMLADRVIPAGQLGRIETNLREAWRHFITASIPGRDIPYNITEAEEHHDLIAKDLHDYLATYLTPEETILAKQLQEHLAKLETVFFAPSMALGKSGKREELLALVLDKNIYQELEATGDTLGALVQLQVDVSREIMQAQATQFRRNTWLAIGLTATGVSLGLFTAVALSLRLTRRINTMTGILDRLSGGQIGDRIDLSARDEFAAGLLAATNLQATLAYAQVSTRETRNRTMSAFDTSVGGVIASMSGSIQAMQGTAQSQSTVSGQVASNAQTVAASASELNASIKEIASQTTHVSELARAAAQTADSSRTTMASLAKAANEITAVAKLIADIAEQTNLLALNATIEAARAGEVGRGFAVVAGEVKNLASQTHGATGDINRKIAAVQTDAQAAVAALESVTGSIAKLNDAAHAIAAAVEEQSAVVDEVARNAEQAAVAAKETGAAAKAVSQAASDLAQGETALNSAVAKFKTGING
jgi:aerotaxis receptor